MKRIVVVLGVVTLMLTILAGPVAAQAVTETNRETFLGAVGTNDCDDSEILIESIFRMVGHSTTDANGGIHSFVQVSVQGVTAKDANGETFRFVGHTYEGSNVIEVPSTGTTNTIFRIISSGASDNRLLSTLVHITVNANGEVTSLVFDHMVECRG